MQTKPKKRIAILGGGIAGITAAWQLAQLDPTLDVTLFEASSRLGGTVETVRRDGFVLECGPDGWVTEKPWARDLAIELGLEDQLIHSNDATRVTWILVDGVLTPMPDSMRMMVPTDLDALDASPLFTEAAKQAYAAEPTRAVELRATAPDHDESIASFVLRHFGPEVLEKVAAPLLTGVFGGDVTTLSVRAVMPAFVAMEREHGSLITALQSRPARTAQPIFTTLKGGTATLIDRMTAAIPPDWISLATPVHSIARSGEQWEIRAGTDDSQFDTLFLAVPAHVARKLLEPVDTRMAELLQMDQTSAVVAALAFTEPFDLPAGFGFLVPGREHSLLMAGTFVDQKFPHRAPPGSHILRAFFGGAAAAQLSPLSDEAIAATSLQELSRILGPLPQPEFSVIRRWPLSLPQYSVGHLDRMAELSNLTQSHPNLWLLGNAHRGVGLPDLIRDARQAARDAGKSAL